MTRRRLRAGATLIPAVTLAVGLAASLRGQDPVPPPTPVESPHSADDAAARPVGPVMTVGGVVLNAATGHPLPRALVSVAGSRKLGALTDGDGRFEIHGVPAGVQTFEVKKPGFRESESDDDDPRPVSRMVQVGEGMPALTLRLAPENAIYGHVTLSSGVPAVGIGLILVRQLFVDGRVSWREADRRQTSMDGAFRFPGLAGGTYLLLTQPEFDNERAGEPRCTADAPAERLGYAAEFYNNAQDMAGAARIAVAGGQGAEVNMALSLTRFHLVEASLARAPAGDQWGFTHTLLDHSGLAVEYPVHEEKDHTLCAYLPDGSYMLTVGMTRSGVGLGSGAGEGSGELAGLLEFSVDGQAVRNLRVPLAHLAGTPVQMRYEPGPPEAAKSMLAGRDVTGDADTDPISLSATRANVVYLRGQPVLEAIERGKGTYELVADAPGAYWIQAEPDHEGECVGAVSAGGQNLARVPWTAGPSGAGAPIEVVMRTDCARLTVQVAASLAGEEAGEVGYLQVYAVPEFDSMAGVGEVMVDLLSDRTATMADLTPGTYRVFAFRGSRSLEYMNPAAMERLGAGQEVTLEPHGHATLVLEGISK